MAAFLTEAGTFRDFGSFAALTNVPYGMRALAPGSDMKPLTVYEVMKPIPNVLSVPAFPWFGQIGQDSSINFR